MASSADSFETPVHHYDLHIVSVARRGTTVVISHPQAVLVACLVLLTLGSVVKGHLVVRKG